MASKNIASANVDIPVPVFFQEVGTIVQGKYNGLPVYRDNNFESIIEPNTAWICSLKHNVNFNRGTQCYFAVPIQKVDENFYYALSNSNKAEIAAAIAKCAPEVCMDEAVKALEKERLENVSKTWQTKFDAKVKELEESEKKVGELTKALEDSKKESKGEVDAKYMETFADMSTRLTKALARNEELETWMDKYNKTTGEYTKEINGLKKQIADYIERVNNYEKSKKDSEAAVKKYEAEIEDLKSQLAVAKTVKPIQNEASTEIAVGTSGTLKSDWFDQPRYAVHLNPVKRILRICPDSKGTVSCKDNTMRIVGIDNYIPSGTTTLTASISDGCAVVSY